MNNLITQNKFGRVFPGILNKHAPIKVKMLKSSSNFLMTKNLRKAVMHRSKFKNYFYKYPSNGNFTIVKSNKISVWGSW